VFHVKQDYELNRMFSFLAEQNILLNTKQKQQVRGYVELLAGWSKRINLISKNDVPFIVERHILVSFYYVYTLLWILENKNIKIIDIGTGAGLPGVVLSIFFPENSITLLDSSRKKYLFLKRAAVDLGLNAELVCDRLENLNTKNEDLYDVAVLRAVAGIQKLCGWGKLILNEKGFLYTIKGGKYKSEYTEDDLQDIDLIEMPIEEPWKVYSKYFNEKTIICLEY
jgi:16S rRNA (guanine527-N7)-methyltransferase